MPKIALSTAYGVSVRVATEEMAEYMNERNQLVGDRRLKAIDYLADVESFDECEYVPTGKWESFPGGCSTCNGGEQNQNDPCACASRKVTVTVKFTFRRNLPEVHVVLNGAEYRSYPAGWEEKPKVCRMFIRTGRQDP